jgi:hypothetical protein
MISSHSARRYLLHLAPAILIAAATACGPFRRSAGPPPAVLVFTNSSLSQADVFVVAQGLGARRIGTVMAGRTDTLVVPSDITTRGGTVSIVARLFARRQAPQTGPVSIFPGEWYEVRLPTDARLLSFLPART